MMHLCIHHAYNVRSLLDVPDRQMILYHFYG